MRPDPRYADDCMRLLTRSMQRHKTAIQEYEVKVFGGGNMSERTELLEARGNDSIGEKNVQAAIGLLLAADANIAIAHVGEAGYRNVVFDCATGDVWVKFRTVQARHGDLRPLSGKV